MIVAQEAYLEYLINDRLEHHGVKGQKWGIRHPRLENLEFWKTSTTAQKAKAISDFNLNAQSKHGGPSHFTDEEKKIALGAAVAGLITIGVVATHGKLLDEAKPVLEDLAKERASFKPGGKISDKLSRQLFNESVTNRAGTDKSFIFGEEHKLGLTIPKDASFKRISFDAEKDMQGQPATWVTYETEDQIRYKSMFGSNRDITNEISIKAAKDVKIPGTEDLISAVQESLGKGGKLASRDEAIKAVTEMTQGYYDGEMPTKVIDTLKSKGYGGVYDYNDVGIVGESPIALFNTDAVGEYTSHEVTDQELETANNSLTALKNYPWISN